MKRAMSDSCLCACIVLIIMLGYVRDEVGKAYGQPSRLADAASRNDGAMRLREKVQEKLKVLYEPYRLAGNARPPDDLDAFAFLADAMGSTDKSMRSEAARLLAELPYGLRASYSDGFLGSNHPVEVRMAALLHSLRAQGVEAVGYAAKMNSKWTEVIRNCLCGPVTPPYFVNVGRVLPTSDCKVVGLSIEQQRMLARRMLYSIGSSSSDAKESFVEILSKMLDKTAVAAEIASWYSVESDASARRVVLREVCVDGDYDEAPAALVSLREIGTLAMKDWDDENAGLGKVLLTYVTRQTGGK